MRVFVLNSGSSGNGMLIESGDTRVLIDAGLGPRVAARRLRDLGRDLFPRGVDAVIVTHHHGDHVSQAEPLARALRVPLYMHAGISASRVRARWEVRAYRAGVPFRVGSLEVCALVVPHDAPQVALAVGADEGPRFGIATDLGHVPATLAPFLGACDAALVEANYCPAMLAVGPYPARLRRRISGGFGHLANEQTADLAAALVGSRLGRLYLGHISRSNNSPERALAVVRARCGGLDVEAVPHGEPRAFDVARTGRVARVERLGSGRAGQPVGEQLALGFG